MGIEPIAGSEFTIREILAVMSSFIDVNWFNCTGMPLQELQSSMHGATLQQALGLRMFLLEFSLREFGSCWMHTVLRRMLK